MKLTVTNSVNGFSSFNLSLNSILEDLILRESINLFFNSLEDNKKYFILLRLQYLENKQFITLHNGLIVKKDQSSQYFQYCKDILSIKSA